MKEKRTFCHAYAGGSLENMFEAQTTSKCFELSHLMRMFGKLFSVDCLLKLGGKRITKEFVECCCCWCCRCGAFRSKVPSNS